MALCSKVKTLKEFKDICNATGLDMIEELIKGAPNRSTTFRKAIAYLDKHKPSVLIETGTSRGRFDINLPSICGDGGSTMIFALWCSKNNAKIHTVDIDPNCIENCKLNIDALGLSDFVEFVVSDSVAYLQNLKLDCKLKFLFLDSYDFDSRNPIPSQKHHEYEYLAVKDKIDEHCCILIDDCGLVHGGKGYFVEQQLVKDGFKLTENGYQHLYER